MSKYDVSKFRNVTVALNTPFKKDGSVDVDAIKAVCRYFRDKGIKQMYVCGTEVQERDFFWILRSACW